MFTEENENKYLSDEIKMRPAERERFIKQAEKLRRNMELRKKQLRERAEITQEKKDGED